MDRNSEFQNDFKNTELSAEKQDLLSKSEKVIVSVETIIPDIKPATVYKDKISIIEAGSSPNPQPYAEDLARNIRQVEDFDKFFEFNNQIVVDLAAGDLQYGYEIAVKSGAKAYIGVDKFNARALSAEIPRAIRKGRYESLHNPIPAAVVDEDMLSFLRRLPEKSVSIFCSGLDWTILPDNKYNNAVRIELNRVISPEGCCVVYASIIKPSEEQFDSENFDDQFTKDFPGITNEILGLNISEIRKFKPKNIDKLQKTKKL